MSQFRRFPFLSRPLPHNDQIDQGTRFDDLSGSLEDFGPEEPEPSDREGLPPGFRMRHDSHYVEQFLDRAAAPLIRNIPINEIDAPLPPGDDDLAPLIASISALGVVQPLLVRRRNGRYDLIAGTRRLAAAAAAGLREVPCLVHEADDGQTRVLAEASNLRAVTEQAPAAEPAPDTRVLVDMARQVADAAATVATCAALLPERGRPLREQLAIDLMRVEARRLGWLSRAWAVLSGPVELQRRAITTQALVARVVRELRPDAGRSATSIEARPVAQAVLDADPDLLVLALTGAATALAKLRRQHGDVAVRIGLDAESNQGECRLSVDATCSPSADADPELSRAGGPQSFAADAECRLSLALAERVAALHGGRMDAALAASGPWRLALAIPLSS